MAIAVEDNDATPYALRIVLTSRRDYRSTTSDPTETDASVDCGRAGL
jgi:hypothetical protein